MNAEGADVHVVVFDVNVYLDVADLLGPPFTWEKFDEAARKYAGEPLPSRDARVDSLRALSVTSSGSFAGDIPLEVWTSAHIDRLVQRKARQSSTAFVAEDRGLGWSPEDAAALLDDLVYGLVLDKTNGVALGEIPIPYGNPPLSHEDGCVYRTALDAGDSEWCQRFCVTRDREFREARLPGDMLTLYPHEWVGLVRKSRQAIAMDAIHRSQHHES